MWFQAWQNQNSFHVLVDRHNKYFYWALKDYMLNGGVLFDFNINSSLIKKNNCRKIEKASATVEM